MDDVKIQQRMGLEEMRAMFNCNKIVRIELYTGKSEEHTIHAPVSVH